MDVQLIRAFCVEDLKGILRVTNWSSSPEGRLVELLILLEKHTKGVRHLQPRQYAALQCLLSVESLALPYEADSTTPEFTETVALEHSRERLTEKLQAYVLHLSPDEAAPLMFPKEHHQHPAPAPDTAPPAPEVAGEIDFTMVATRQQLIDAFGTFTGMSMAWFDNLKDTPRLKAARKYIGQGGRHSAEPLFCPHKVMQWLVDPQRKKGKPINDTTAWRLLKGHFPKVYNQHSTRDPNAD